MADARGFDLVRLEKIERQLGQQKAHEIIALFLDHAPARLNRIREGASNGDLDDPAEALHSIKSSAAMLGAEELEQVAASMERAARELRSEAFHSRMPDLERVIREADEFLRRRIGGNAP